MMFSSPELKAHNVRLKDGTPAGFNPSVRVSTLSNMNIADASGLIGFKFYLRHHRGMRKAT